MRPVSANSLSFPRILKRCAIVVGVFLLLELVIFNIVILYAFWNLSGAISAVVNAPGATLFGPRREKTCLRGFANNTGADQPAHPRSLISAFVIRVL